MSFHLTNLEDSGSFIVGDHSGLFIVGDQSRTTPKGDNMNVTADFSHNITNV